MSLRFNKTYNINTYADLMQLEKPSRPIWENKKLDKSRFVVGQ